MKKILPIERHRLSPKPDSESRLLIDIIFNKNGSYFCERAILMISYKSC
jgi:hypothetical protein